ncbi:MAG: tRNA pseudouridine(55) synthase TruB [Bacteroidetes bacterium]|nr:tRNA pseudouridine(55) synthase TruB [Bacteroidota bacterium]
MKEFNFSEGEVLLINKPYNWTSFDVVNNIRYFIRKTLDLPKIKIGHAGTLDPLATGLLVLCTGKFTKKIDEFQAQEKEYTGTFTIGETTPSFDMEKEVDFTFDYSHVNEKLILQTVQKFTGTFEQIPPVFSAVKIGGKRAYEFARNSEEVKISSKTITISEFEITNIQLPVIYFRIVCGKGTYIRALARDFGETMQCGAYLSALCRTRIGNFELKDALDIDILKSIIIEHTNNKSSPII